MTSKKKIFINDWSVLWCHSFSSCSNIMFVCSGLSRKKWIAYLVSIQNKEVKHVDIISHPNLCTGGTACSYQVHSPHMHCRSSGYCLILYLEVSFAALWKIHKPQRKCCWCCIQVIVIGTDQYTIQAWPPVPLYSYRSAVTNLRSKMNHGGASEQGYMLSFSLNQKYFKDLLAWGLVLKNKSGWKQLVIETSLEKSLKSTQSTGWKNRRRKTKCVGVWVCRWPCKVAECWWSYMSSV